MADERPPARRAWVEQIMGMPISVHLRGTELESPAVCAAVAGVFAELREVDALFSTFRADSQISAINRGELEPSGYHPLVTEVVGLCAEATELTGGYFAANRQKPDGARWFDPAGLVKGWAVERASARLGALAGVDFCLNAGGDIMFGGSAPWSVGIEDPTDPGRLVASVSVTHGAVATSGSAHRGAHLVVPHTGHSAMDPRAATVIGPSLTWADVFATAAVARGRSGLRWLAGLQGYVGLVVKPGGAALVTPGWPV